MLNKISLRLRLTILTAIILISICTVLTAISVMNANNVLVRNFENSISTEVKVIEPGSPTDEVERDGKMEMEVQVISDMQGTINRARAMFAYNSTIYLILITIGGVIITWFVAGTALKPVTNLSNIVNKIDENNLSEGIPKGSSNDEISRLTNSFNNVLQKLSIAFESEKRFSKNAAHELKTPLAAMLTTIEVAEIDEEPTLDECKEIINITKDNIEKMINIVGSLELINNNLIIEMNEVFDGRNLFFKIINGYKFLIKEKNIEIEVIGDAKYIGNKNLIERALSNLIQNSIRYNINNGKIKVELNKNEIRISDTGIGIPKDSLERVFESFYCVDESRSKKLGGSGLGLSIVKSILDKHNWNIKIDSEVKKGTIITIKTHGNKQ